MDAEYYNPAKKAFLDRLHALPGRPLYEYYQPIREMFDPSRANKSEVVRNFDLSAALQPVLDDETPVMLASEVGSLKKRFAAGDVVISKLRSYLREIALVRTSPTAPSVGSSEFIVLRSRVFKESGAHSRRLAGLPPILSSANHTEVVAGWFASPALW